MGLPNVNQFRKWLKSKDPYDEVGQRGIADDCPLACFFKDTLGISYIEVTDDFVWRAGKKIHNPEWRREFISRVDRGMRVSDLDRRVFAYEALEILEEVTQ